MRARKNAAAEAGENERGSAPHRCVCAHCHAQPPRGTQRVALGAAKRRRARSHCFRTRAKTVIVCALTGNMCPGKKRVDQAFVCEGLDENSWQSRPRHAVLSPTPGRLPPRGTTAADLARVMLLLDASTIAKNVGRCLLFAGSRRAAPSHSDLGLLRRHYQRGRQQDFVPGTRVPRSGLPRVFDRALAYISTSTSMQTPGGRCICTHSCLTRVKHSWRTCWISDTITDTCTATTAGSVHTATVRYQDKLQGR